MTHELETKLPSKVYVGHYEFAIRVVPQDDPGIEGNDGLCDPASRTIWICSGLSLWRLFYVVNHEICHAVNWSKGVEDGMTEESFTTLNSDGETDLWVDNPRLINWKLKAARAIRKQRSERTEV
jgi:hypothetical protein